jgi:hypothetical protein
MTESLLAARVEKTCRYLHSTEGRLTVRTCMRGMGWSYERAVAAAVMTACHLVKYEHIAEVADAVIVEELAVGA